MYFFKILITAVVIIPALVRAQDTDSTRTVALDLVSYRSINYPRAAIEAGVDGTVMVEIVIDQRCIIKNKSVLTGLGYGLDEAALNVFDEKFEVALIRTLKTCSADTLIMHVRFRLE